MGKGLGYRAKQAYNTLAKMPSTAVYAVNIGLNAAGRVFHSGFDYFAGGTATVGLATKGYELIFKDTDNKYVKALRSAAFMGAVVLGGLEAWSCVSDPSFYDGTQAAINLWSANALANDMKKSNSRESVPKQIKESGKFLFSNLYSGVDRFVKWREDVGRRKSAKKAEEERRKAEEEDLEGRIGSSDGAFGSLLDNDYDIDLD